MSSISTQVLSVDLADHVHDLGLVRLRAAFVDDREAGIVEPFGERAGALDAADVRRDDDHVGVLLLPGVAEQHRRGVDVVDRDVEEALDLIGVHVDGQHAVDAGRRDQVGDELGRDRHARGAAAGDPAGA